MNKKLFMLTLFLAIMLVSMLFASEDNEVFKPTRALSIKSPRNLLVDHKPIQSHFDRSGALLFDQQATAYNTLCACQNDSAMVFFPRIADNFTVPYDANVDSLVWWGGYWGTLTNSIMDFWIEIYPDSGGGLGPMQAPIYSARVGFNEIDLGGWYVYEAVIPPFPATAGVTYWIVFQPFLTYPPQWGNNSDEPPAWGDGQPMFFKSAYFGFPVWTPAMTVFGFDYESSFQIYGPAAGPSSYLWDFETGWQGWTHTNGQAFPAGWGVEWSGIHSSITPPDAGDSTMWIDSDAGGNGFWIQDSALSPVVVPPSGMEWMKWGVGWNQITATEIYEVGLKYFDGAVWTVVPLVNYTADVSPMWDSVDVSAYASYDSIQVYFYYDDADVWAWYTAFDNVSLYAPLAHDVGCVAVTSPVGSMPAGNYDVIGQIHNFGGSAETFDATAQVWDTTGGAWTEIFNQTATFTAFAVGADSLHNFGTVTFVDDSYYYTQIYTALAGDEDTSNDTSFAYSQTAMALGQIIFELDVETPTGDNHILGCEFDGTYFYVTGGNSGSDPNKVYVIDLSGTLIWTMDQPSHSTSWGWRDVAWDEVYAGADRIDTLYSSVDGNVDRFSVDLTSGALEYHGYYDGPENPNRALACQPDTTFYTANFSGPCYWFSKWTSNLGSGSNSYAMYGSAYDTYAGWVWWHSQDDLGGGWPGAVEQWDPPTLTFTGITFNYNPTITVPGAAGGLCFFEDFLGMDVLFAVVQGTPDAIIGLFIRNHVGVEEEPGVKNRSVFTLEACKPNPVANGKTTIAYTTTKTGPVSLKIYDSAGRLVKTLVDRNEDAGVKNVYWDCTDNNHQPVSAGIYFYRLTAQNRTATNKMVVVK